MEKHYKFRLLVWKDTNSTHKIIDILTDNMEIVLDKAHKLSKENHVVEICAMLKEYRNGIMDIKS